MKNCVTLFLLFVILCSSFICLMASPLRVVDEAKLLSEEQYLSLLEKVNEVSNDRNIDIVILTVESLGDKDIVSYADDYYDYNGYGPDFVDSGLLFLLSMENRDWAISTCGLAVDIFTDNVQERIIDYIGDEMSSGDYYDAFCSFVSECDFYLEPEEETPLSTTITFWAFVSLIIGLISALITTSIMKSKLKSVRSKDTADEYVKSGSLNITVNKDTYLYQNVVKRKRESSSGSSVHKGSSGKIHGGSHGKF